MATANSILKSAIAAGFDGLSPRDVMLCILQGVSAGGTGGGSANYVANYAGGTPTPVPTSGNPFAVDTSIPALWVWNGAAWVSIIA